MAGTLIRRSLTARERQHLDRRHIIEEPPEQDKSEVREQCDESLLCFLETIFPEVFPLAWSDDHIAMIHDVQKRIVHGGLKSIAYPRGSGKTSILLRAAMWAAMTGKRKFIVLVGANEGAAGDNLSTIKSELNHNPQIKKYYDRETICIRNLEGEPRRVLGQTGKTGKHTGVEYNVKRINFGDFGEDSLSAGALIASVGITGQIRGQQAATLTGKIIRPDLVLVDDPQSKDSAASATQVIKRHETMMGDILGLAGPGIKISGFCTCTVIYQDDLADRLLSRELSPDWNGDKISMIKSWPKNVDLWDKYNVIRVEELAKGIEPSDSLQFVRDNYEELHEGSAVYWEARKSEKDVSALQHAMDLYYRDQSVFHAEFQNAPAAAIALAPFDINKDAVARRVTGIPRGRVPQDTDKITAFIDVQRELLYYCIVAWTMEGRAYVIDYGSCPDQKTLHWIKRDVRFSLKDYYGSELEEALRGGLEWLIEAIMSQEYADEGGGTLSVDRMAIDARWGESTHIVRRVVRENKHRPRIHPSMGVYIGANSKQWQMIKLDKRDKKGIHAKLTTPKEPGRKELIYDTNYWKSFVADRLTCLKSANKAITLFHAEPHMHRCFAEHMAAEEPIRSIGKANNEVVEWRLPPHGSTDNDFFDCLVGCCALASIIGVETHQGNMKARRTNRLANAIRHHQQKGFRSR